jgi:hypothetical protein
MRGPIPRCSPWHTAQSDTLSLRLIMLAAGVIETKTRIAVQLPTACSVQTVLRLQLERIPRLAT